MEIQWSLVLFTALSGAGAWLVACAGLDAFKGLAKKTVVPAVIVGIVLIVVGGIASATHLSHVDRIMAVLAHPAPGIFLEALLLGIDVVVAAVFLVLYKRNASEGVLKGLGIAAVAMAAIFSYACGSSYMMSSQLAWNTIALPLGYLGTALAAGTALWYLLCAVLKEEAAALSFAATETLVGAAVALVTSLAYGLMAGIVGGDSAILFWVGVVICGGVVPLACGVVGMKKTDGALSLAIVAVVGAFIGSVAYRVLMWTASIALMSLFGVSI
ncbi:DmsC/YnfH family molybdoenzyme membrane anchor subunit [Adlercreutzia sp. R25]|uniref:DmsC/YnfH family molybdoenzyme membrane anchor subunit n=1 Tax=Adlercreutzia shanghongiae TaxID=3111773 RepID=A0ABU6J192_9ACTN|nr:MULTISPECIES: DmsC/YnfH family molybdoenzyme membrane anchor subunit [unclassified Adlercreutzia]MEC4273722.1 DmsC/YnfH family molybdoenzyme membrane anchor subunit [Adlercreutzia sp. R25]MEC4295877.1 DmsC/YnfH family molybdoenzyme membrane anchor subunit [Adlercreutzia sp. R22]